MKRESRRPRKRRRNLKQLYHDLVILGYAGSYDRVAAFARDWRQREREAVHRPGRGKQCKVNARFRAMVSHFLFEADFCNPAAGWKKGQIEKIAISSRLAMIAIGLRTQPLTRQEREKLAKKNQS